VVTALGASARPWVVAVDLPSGIGVDDGTVAGPVLRADRTVTFGAAKPGLLLPPAAGLAGELTVVDIGLDLDGEPAVRRLEAADVARAWAVPGPADHKYSRGVVGVVAGTSTYPGAAVLAASAAVRAGAGMVRYVGPEAVGRAVLSARPEVVTAAGRVQAWAVGSGVPTGSGAEQAGQDDGQHDRVRHALAEASGREGAAPERTVPVVVDAGGLGLLEPTVPPWFVLTPHAGELATLLRDRGEDVDRALVEAQPLRWARRAHELTGATVLLKGGVTVVVGPDAATSAAFVHGRAAHAANPGGPVAALDVADAVPGVVAQLLAPR
jgi:NAD(P)H-hydrate repair Nnr-like enzyme with NAD(P)H-hydrate dehydratase domain